MAKSINNSQLYLDIYSLIRVWGPNMTYELSRYLLNQLGLFSVETTGKLQDIDILLLQLEEVPVLTSSEQRLNLIYGFVITEYQNQQAIIFNYRGGADIIAIFSDNIKIFYRNRIGISKKLYGILLFCFNLVLNKKNGLLFHGAIAKNENNGILLAGHRGTKKSMLLLTLLRNGWDYLSDDKFILHNNNSYLFQSFIPLRGHHFNSLPWLAELNKNSEKFIRRSKLREKARNYSIRKLPGYLQPTVERFFGDPSITVYINKLFPSSNLIQSTRPSKVFVLLTGSQFRLENIPRDKIIDEIITVQKLLFHKYSQLEYLLSIYNKSFKYDIKKILDKNLPDQMFFKLTVPDDLDISSVYQEVIHCLKQVS
jgi:hypothetical protein